MKPATMDLHGAERTVYFEDGATGLAGAIVIHSTVLGAAAGGCRVWDYSDTDTMIADGLRLARGMTYKNAMAGLPLGGGKAVLRGPIAPELRAEYFAAFGRAVEGLSGAYITAEDVGTTVEDMEAVSLATRHVAGLPARRGAPGGDPSPWTAQGVFDAMEVAARDGLGLSLSKATVAIQGLGNVGYALARLLHDNGAKLVVAESRSEIAARAAVEFGAYVVSSNAILEARADIFAPCALGAILDEQAIDALRVGLVCGGANNQLRMHEDADRLHSRGILYVPDYVANAGGIISVAGEHLGWTVRDVEARVAEIGPRVESILTIAKGSGGSPQEVADTMANRILSRRADGAFLTA